MTLSTSRPLVYLISDGELTNTNYPDKSEEFLSLVKVAVEVRIPLIQMREKHLSGRDLYNLVKSVMKLTDGSNTKVLVNDRVDVAIAARADGVHLPANSVPIEVVRRSVPKTFLIGLSAHSENDVSTSSANSADFVVLGPVYPTPGKGKPLGLYKFETIVNGHAELPILGLGGIEESNFQVVLGAGAAGFAAIRFLNNDRNLEMVSRELNL